MLLGSIVQEKLHRVTRAKTTWPKKTLFDEKMLGDRNFEFISSIQ
jgi:hypothetical protein